MTNRGKRGLGTTVSTELLFADAPRKAKPKHSADLLATIQDQILPRLALAHYADAIDPESPLSASAKMPPTTEDIAHLTEIAIRGDVLGALRFTATLMSQGASAQSVLLLVVAPAARLLNDQWTDARHSFENVMTGLDVMRMVAETLGTLTTSSMASAPHPKH